MTRTNFLLPCLGLFCLIAINAFFTAAEFSIVSVRRSRISELVKSGDVEAQTVQSFQRGIDRLLSTTQLGITLSSLALGWIGEQTIAVLITHLIAKLPLSASIINSLSYYLAIPLAFIFLVYLQIILGELVPKSLALLYPEQLARFFAPPSLVISRIFRPFIEVLNISTRLLLKLSKINYTKQAWQEQLTAKELQLIINTEKNAIDLEATDRELLNNVLKFGNASANEIMIPRTKIKFLAEDATFAELLQKIATEKYFRYPIIGKSLDDIKGIIDYKSLAIPLAEGKLINDSLIAPWIKPVQVVEETKPVKDLLSLMQQENQAMVIVIDKFGGTSGLITLQDLVTEIIGNQDSFDYLETHYCQQIDFNTYIVSAHINIEDINECLEIQLPIGEEYHTLSGFLQEQWQKIPSQGETLIYQNLKFTILATENNCLHQIKIELLEDIQEDFLVHNHHNNGFVNNNQLNLESEDTEI